MCGLWGVGLGNFQAWQFAGLTLPLFSVGLGSLRAWQFSDLTCVVSGLAICGLDIVSDLTCAGYGGSGLAVCGLGKVLT